MLCHSCVEMDATTAEMWVCVAPQNPNTTSLPIHAISTVGAAAAEKVRNPNTVHKKKLVVEIALTTSTGLALLRAGRLQGVGACTALLLPEDGAAGGWRRARRGAVSGSSGRAGGGGGAGSERRHAARYRLLPIAAQRA